MRILLLGKNGQLGWEFQRTLLSLGEVLAWDWQDVDLEDSEILRGAVRQAAPQVIVNAAAYTAVDRAESEPEKARAINASAPAVLAEEAQRLEAGIIHFSTEYVFNGEKQGNYIETDEPGPLNVYAMSKLEGEKEVASRGGAYWIFRTSWVFSERRDNFVNKVLQWSRSQSKLRVVNDQWGSPTWSRALAEITTQVLAMGRSDPVEWVRQTAGLYHVAGDGGASRYEFAQEILRLDPQRDQQVVQEIVEARSSDFPAGARRPLNGVLDCSKFKLAFGVSLPPWRRSLELMFER